MPTRSGLYGPIQSAAAIKGSTEGSMESIAQEAGRHCSQRRQSKFSASTTRCDLYDSKTANKNNLVVFPSLTTDFKEAFGTTK